MTTNPVAVSVENVTQRFRIIHERPDSLRELFAKFSRRKITHHDFEAVSDVSLEVRRGEMIGIVGRNGSGKSTLLKIIAGVYTPSSGRVTVNGTLAPLIELGAGMHTEMTGRENILLNGLLMGYSKHEMRQREQQIVDFADIGEFIDVPVKQYSSGMYMRLAFAVATEIDPEILVVDEILAVGDFAFQQKCFNRLRRFRESGKTILMVTHTMGPVIEYCNRAILIEKGRVVADGPPVEVVERYTGSSAVANEPVLVEAPTAHA
ncbi:MAG TPA: ABC transporter ATP-binding protein [Bryobacteraceae bacterium]|nr:ABC transporter ATP-binding protein [Bryobacteraceae bacterium]